METNNSNTQEKHWCEKCGRKLNNKKIVWLELSMTDGQYYTPDKFPKDHESQGGFAFGVDCAKDPNNNFQFK